MFDDDTPFFDVVALTILSGAAGILALFVFAKVFPVAADPVSYILTFCMLFFGLDSLNTFRKRFPIFRKRLQERKASASKA